MSIRKSNDPLNTSASSQVATVIDLNAVNEESGRFIGFAADLCLQAAL